MSLHTNAEISSASLRSAQLELTLNPVNDITNYSQKAKKRPIHKL